MDCFGCSRKLTGRQRKWHSEACRKQTERLFAADIPLWLGELLQVGRRGRGPVAFTEIGPLLKRAYERGYATGSVETREELLGEALVTLAGDRDEDPESEPPQDAYFHRPAGTGVHQLG